MAIALAAGLLQTFALAANAAAIVTAPATDPPRVTFPTGTQCPAIVVYASRGSGEAFDDSGLGAGTQLVQLYKDLVAEYGVQNVGLESNGYPAVPVVNPWTHLPDPYYLLHDYKPSVLRGVKDAVADIKALASRCKSQSMTLVVAGYSQGADVTRRALAQVPPSGLSNKFVMTLLFGDPNFSPREDLWSNATNPIIENGDFYQAEGAGRHLYKTGGLPPPPSIEGLYDPISWCHHGDPVCQFGDLNIARHEDYAARDIASAAFQITNSAPWRLPLAMVASLPEVVGKRQAPISPAYFSPLTGPNKGRPTSALFTTYIDGREVDSRWIPQAQLLVNNDYFVRLPDKNWHVVSVYALGHLITQKRIRSSS
jgi:hypothetical protein